MVFNRFYDILWFESINDYSKLSPNISMKKNFFLFFVNLKEWNVCLPIIYLTDFVDIIYRLTKLTHDEKLTLSWTFLFFESWCYPVCKCYNFLGKQSILSSLFRLQPSWPIGRICQVQLTIYFRFNRFTIARVH